MNFLLRIPSYFLLLVSMITVALTILFTPLAALVMPVNIISTIAFAFITILAGLNCRKTSHVFLLTLEGATLIHMLAVGAVGYRDSDALKIADNPGEFGRVVGEATLRATMNPLTFLDALQYDKSLSSPFLFIVGLYALRIVLMVRASARVSRADA